MIIIEDHVDLDTPTGKMRTFTYRPKYGGPYPGVVLFSEIYQVTGPIERTARLLASNGYVVAAPEVYHEFEPLGSPFPYDEEGTDKGNRYKIEKEVSSFDSDARTLIQYLQGRDDCTGNLGCLGICMGGHLSFRCAMNEEIKAAVCFYATDIHKHSLGKGKSDNSLDRAGEIKGELLMVWGRQDRHVDRAGRRLIYDTITDAGVHFTWHEYNARHAFVRDEGYRYNASLAGHALSMALEIFQKRLQLDEPIDPEDRSTAGTAVC